MPRPTRADRRRRAIITALAVVGSVVVDAAALNLVAPAHAAAASAAPGSAHRGPGKVAFPTRAAAATATTAPQSPLAYGGGVDQIGVTTGPPRVYLVFYGSQWGTQGSDGSGNATFSGDPDGVAPRLQQLFNGLGTDGETWSGVMTQYCQGVATGATSCPGTAAHVGYPTGALAGIWADEAAASPLQASENGLAVEAVRAAGHFGNTTAASNRNAQYVVVSPTGTHPDGFNLTARWCAWHDWNGDTTLTGGAAPSSYGDIAFTNLPYIPDAGASCGQAFVNSGTAGALDGVTIVEGHEYAETITDQNPMGGWSDSKGEENGDKCAWINPGTPGGAANVSFATGSFAMQSTWSNDTSGCLIGSTLPGAPLGVAATPGTGKATVSFSPPATSGGAQITTYTVTAADTTTPANGHQTASGGGSPITVTGLTDGDAYTFTVTATTVAGTGPASAPSNAVIPASPPGAPTGVSATPGNALATVSFAPPSDNGGSAITSYRISATDTTAQARGGQTATGTASPVTVTGLTNGDTYTFTVTAANAIGTGPASAPSNAVTPITVPSAPSGLAATGGDGVVSLSWTAPASNGGSAVTGYTVYRSTSSGSRGNALASPAFTGYTDTSAVNGTTYYYSVTATNAAGQGPGSAQVAARPHGTPTVTLTGHPSALSATRSATFTFTTADPNGEPVTTTCRLDGAASTACPSGVTYDGLSDGTHSVVITAADAEGTGSTASYGWTVDATAPSVTMRTPTTRFVLGPVTARWAGSDSGSGVISYAVRYRRAAPGGRFGSWTYPAGWQQLAGTSATRSERPGNTDCFSVRARDRAGNVSPWSPQRCVAVVLDDRALIESSGWSRGRGAAYYFGTVTATARRGATLRVGPVVSDRLAVVATRCPSCGTVQVSVGGRTVATLRLTASRLIRRAVLVLPRFALRSGAVVLRVVSSGRPVRIDGLGTTRA